MKILIILTLVFLSNPSWAWRLGDVKGNGGDIVICKDEPFLSLDLYELKHRYKLEQKIFANENGIEIAIEDILRRLSDYSPDRAKLYQEWYLKFDNEALFVDHEISDIEDTGNRIQLQSHCTIKQIINQNSQILLAPKRYIINKPLWDKIDANSKLSLILHEFLYRENPAEDSENIRKFNAYWLADELKNLDFFTYIEWIKKIGLVSNRIQNLIVNLQKPITYYYQDDISKNKKLGINKIVSLKSAYALSQSSYSFAEMNFQMEDAPVEFYNNSVPASLCFKGSNVLKYKNNEILLYCHNKFMSETYLHFYENGNIKSGFIEGGQISNLNYHINLSKNHSGSLMWNSYIEFYNNKELKLITNSAMQLYIQEKQIQLDERQLEFHPNSMLKSAKWKFKTHIDILGAERELISNFEMHENNKFKSIIFAKIEHIDILGQSLAVLPNSKLEFYNNSNLKSFRTAVDIKLKDRNNIEKDFKALQMIEFNPDYSFK